MAIRPSGRSSEVPPARAVSLGGLALTPWAPVERGPGEEWRPAPAVVRRLRAGAESASSPVSSAPSSETDRAELPLRERRSERPSEAPPVGPAWELLAAERLSEARFAERPSGAPPLGPAWELRPLKARPVGLAWELRPSALPAAAW